VKQPDADMENTRHRSGDHESKKNVRYNLRSQKSSDVDEVQSITSFHNSDLQNADMYSESSVLAMGTEKLNKNGFVSSSELQSDQASIALLMLLYVLQGIPLGIAGSIPYLLSSRHISYKDQALFSLVHWPFSIKLLWAPIVDSVFIPKIGRRKSWLVPTQYLIGLFMFLLSRTDAVAELMNPTTSTSVNVTLLTAMFFSLNFLAATQDIAVDGWALTMLSK
jgi:Acetyl-coenzyme A transporter 1